ncbi:MAG: acyl-CoA dehydratase activase [Chitinivibrionia bacterium]|nr:acyl-CoA dehydratase activase [Chitinivibrionia bacterium]MCL1948005.1 acyl-CoA dehydratase activase [Chitinivibrionia bacterium]
MSAKYFLGLDMGSTTVKCAVWDREIGEVVHTDYRRHDSAVKLTLLKILRDIDKKFGGDIKFCAVFTGSQSSGFAAKLGVSHVQEVIAVSIAIAKFYPKTLTSIELGGQDAKILFFSQEDETAVLDMRMNGVCAGGTGAFIDQMASLLNIKSENFNELASAGKKVYDISGRCGVFAKTDIQPLINQGVPREDIALSCLHALAKQTIGGLAQGMEIKTPILFAGGPFFFIPKLVDVFCERLGIEKKGDFIIPENAQTLIAVGAALSLDTALGNKRQNPMKIDEILKKLKDNILDVPSVLGNKKSEKFFDSGADFAEFNKRYKFDDFSFKKYKKGEKVSVFVGIDAGSTTTKFVALDEKKNVIYSFYKNNLGKPVDTAKSGLLEFENYYKEQDVQIEIKGLGTTGYGEILFAKAFGADFHIVETIAHKTAAVFYEPNVSFILDLGGQDMKAIFINDGIITNIALNEACSAGCGSFIESYSKSLNIAPQNIAKLAFEAKNPSVLGSRCTVFMNSSIITEQKSGKSAGDILAGLCRSVIENLFTKVVRIPNPGILGEKIVVQGGTFKNDAVLRAFTQYVGKEVIRPRFSGEMGALGVALLTMEEIGK